ncbi:2-phospho-L-lactate guanylyltransferase [Herbiconiux flava]|uniref:Phosphoenolpyruvate guanylyltransferase n=1 Tax=Herbiconiux flava TaxID=881268 RepID=A0A852ST72_9MICO|nr:2-phospho-L-lactate guanylyltransferase [Herbiconiux flava]NYD71991.1 2-phospho-L-lactate guanylyltransferase [Herbiconiux flava]GLK18046.1 2-phospho-L-lactate guanylyltransferase [Herbiconiux flava]
MTSPWTLVVPVKGTAEGKSRLMPERSAEERLLLAEAFTLDAVAALRAARTVGRVIVVTDAGSSIAARLRETVPGVEVLDDPGEGLNAAVARGIAAADDGPTAAMLGDLPTLVAGDVDEALEAAYAHPLAFVADAEGSGTTLITAAGSTAGAGLVPRFGAGSAGRHRAAGHVALALGDDSTLRHDVDTEAELQQAWRRGVGPATARVLESLKPPAASVLQQ